jgi:hypothetical protein
MYTRDPTFNQAFRQIGDVMLSAPETPPVATADQAIDGIQIIGIGVDPGQHVAPGAKIDAHVYFQVDQPTRAAYQFQLVAWPIAAGGRATTTPASPPISTGLRTTADGAFVTDRWRAGDHVRERFKLTIPADWHGEGVALGLVAVDASGGKHKPTGPALATEPFTAILGVLPADPGAGSSASPHP